MTTPLLLLLLLVPQQEEIKQGDTVKVKMLNTQLRAKPLYFSPLQQSVERGTPLEVLEVKGNWLKVTPSGGKPGWIAKTSVMTAQKYDLSEAQYKIDPDDPNSAKGFSGTEAAATKGFTPEAEAKRRKDDKKIDAAYKELDKLQGLLPRKMDEKFMAELQAFRSRGGLGEFNK